MIVVGIGNQVNPKELDNIAGGSGNALVAATFEDALDEVFVQRVIRKTCALGEKNCCL